MKRLSLVFLFFAAFGMLFLGSCSNEEKLSTYEPNSVEGGKISFVLPLQKKGSVVYTTKAPVVGLDDEYKVENLLIYWFTEVNAGDFRLADIFSTAENTITIDSLPRNSTKPYNEGLVSVMIGAETKASRFYILANVNGSGNVQAGKLDNMVTGSTGMTASEFELIASDELKSGASYKTIATPLPMSINKAAGAGNSGGAVGFIDVPQPQNTNLVTDVQLKRRVARFDIKNNAQYSNFKITKVIVANGQVRGWLQDKALDLSSAPASSWTPADLEIPCSANGTPVSSMLDNETWTGGVKNTTAGVTGDDIPDIFQQNVDAQGNSITPPDSVELNPAAFYIWPTKLVGSATAGSPGSEILIEGVFTKGNVTKLYKVLLPDADPVNNPGVPMSELDIEANKLYTIKITRVSEKTLGFKLVVTDWEDSPEMVVDVPGKDITWGKIRDAKTGNELVDLSKSDLSSDIIVYSSLDADPFKLAIDVKGMNRGGTGGVINVVMKYSGRENVDFLASDWDSTNVATAPTHLIKNTVVTYGAEYLSRDTIILPATDAPLEYTLELHNVASSEVKSIRMRSANFYKQGGAYVGMELKPQTINATLEGLGDGRWKNAVVTKTDGQGMPTEVFAWLGETVQSNYSTFAQTVTTTPEEMIELLNSTCGGNVTYKTGEKWVLPVPNSYRIIPTDPSSLISTVVSKLDLQMKVEPNNVASYKAIIANYDKSASTASTMEFPVLHTDGTLNRRSTSGFETQYPNSKVVALIEY